MLQLGMTALTNYLLDDLEAAATRAGLGGRVRRGEPLARHTSLRVGGPADLYVKADSIEAVIGWVNLTRERELPLFVLGHGSNVLVSERGVRGVVIELACAGHELVTVDSRQQTAAKTYSAAGDQNQTDNAALGAEQPSASAAMAVVRAEAGVSLPALAYQLAKQGWGGFEQAIGIPGAMGACVVNNAGAHGWSMADSVVGVMVLGPAGDVYDLPAEDLQFEYRGSRFKHQPHTEREIVLRADLAVQRADPTDLKARMDHYTAHRRKTQPTDPSIGSMFKNPPGDYAGRLIEAAGLKGIRIGRAQISAKHANFFINLGGATAADVAALIQVARTTVREKFGISLELEIEPLGDWGEGE